MKICGFNQPHLDKRALASSNATNVENGVATLRIKGNVSPTPEMTPINDKVGPTAN